MHERRIIPGCEPYAVDAQGNVYGHNQKKLKPGKHPRGYLLVSLWRNNKQFKVALVHRLVMLAFVGPSDLQVNHKNLDKEDNRRVNLEYCTNEENRAHARANGVFGGRPRNELTLDKTSKVR